MSEHESASSTEPRERVLRVFVSSTFRDMHAEREVLVKRVFPELRELCESRGATLAEVDLRWGVTDEQKAEGKVLPICLEEIRWCRPYFIGLLGERYGWVPEQIPQELIETEPWLAEHLGRSVTELEILHGVLNNPRMAEHSFFYLRDPAYVQKLPPDEAPRFIEAADPDEITRLGREHAEQRAAERRQKLSALKQRIRKSGFPAREGYPDAKALGELVRRDLTSVIDRLFPEGSVPDSRAREEAEHTAFGRIRARVYVERPAYFERLDAHIAGDGLPLVLLGESGGGKSALLANWVRRVRAANMGQFVIEHYVGATPASTNGAELVRRILAELDRRFELGIEIPDNPAALRMAFAAGLHRAAAWGRVILVIDGLNLIEDRDRAPDLAWLPSEMPMGVRLVLSTLPGRPLEEIERRGWPTMTVEPLSIDERRRLTVDYLAQYRKSLDLARVERIVSAEPTGNPLYLRALLEELRVWGQHETLEQRIEHYLGARTMPALYAKIFARWETDYGGEAEFVRQTYSLVWAARRGLSESELLELLGRGGAPLPRAELSPLLLAAGDTLVSRSGLLGFGHDHVRAALEQTYLPSEEARRALHARIAGYFEARSLGGRKVDELPWQLARAKEWQRLYDLLAEPTFFGAAWSANEFEVRTRWTEIEEHSPHRMVEAYADVVAGTDRWQSVEWEVRLLLAATGHWEEALTVGAQLIHRFRVRGDLKNLAGSLGNQALLLRTRGRLDEAMALMREQEQLHRSARDISGLAGSLGNQALVFKERGQLEEAVALLQQQERLCRRLGDADGLATSLGNQAIILKDRGRLDEAMLLMKEQERICRQLVDLDGLAGTLGNQGLILKRRGRLDEAFERYKEQETICRQLGELNGVQTSLGNQAVILLDRGQLDEAMLLMKEQERICRQIGNLDGLKRSLGNQAIILRDRGQLDEAMLLMKEQERICRELCNLRGLQASLANQAVVFSMRGQLDQAMLLMKEQEGICRQLGDLDGLQKGLGNQAVLLAKRGQSADALVLHQEEEALCRTLGDPESLKRSLNNQSKILCARGEFDRAMALLTEVESICRQGGDMEGLQQSLDARADIVLMLNEDRSVQPSLVPVVIGMTREPQYEELNRWGLLGGATKIISLHVDKNHPDAPRPWCYGEEDYRKWAHDAWMQNGAQVIVLSKIVLRRLNTPDRSETYIATYGNP